MRDRRRVCYVSNYENDPLWRSGVTSMHHDPPGPVHLGMRTHEVFRFFGRTLEVEAEIVALQANRSVSFRTISGPLQAEGVRSVEAVLSGTRIAYQANADITGLLAWLAPLVTWSFRRRANTDLARLRNVLEAGDHAVAK